MSAAGRESITETRMAASTLLVQSAQQDQLCKLGSVLNGLENGALRMRRRVYELGAAVRSGSYVVDSLELSRRIIRELAAARA
jgi:anti-sigma28 factor (negative regulator of flagellin synthesis)